MNIFEGFRIKVNQYVSYLFAFLLLNISSSTCIYALVTRHHYTGADCFFVFFGYTTIKEYEESELTDWDFCPDSVR
jgi:hypothetical protein